MQTVFTDTEASQEAHRIEIYPETNTESEIFTTEDANTVKTPNSLPANNFPASTIWDELAVLFSTAPLLPEEIFIPAIPDEETAVIAQDPVGEEATEIKAETQQQEADHHETAPLNNEVKIDPREDQNNIETVMTEKAIDDAEYNTMGEKPIEL
jgi:hypothetical protein